MTVAQATYQMPKKLADIWDVATCSNGHPCYMILGPVYEGAPIRPEIFRPLGKQVPVDHNCRCSTCRALVFRMMSMGTCKLFLQGRAAGMDEPDKA